MRMLLRSAPVDPFVACDADNQRHAGYDRSGAAEAELSWVDHVSSQSSVGPFGAKGVHLMRPTLSSKDAGHVQGARRAARTYNFFTRRIPRFSDILTRSARESARILRITWPR